MSSDLDFNVSGSVDAVLRRKGLVRDPAPGLGASMMQALDKNPDEVSRSRDLARRSGLPVSVASADPQLAEREARLQALDLEKIRREYPATAHLLGNPDVAAVAHDAVDEMGFLERAIRTAGAVRRDVQYGSRQGVRVKDLGLLGWDALMEQADAVDEARIGQIQAEMQADADLGVEPFLFRGVPYAEAAERFVLGIPGGTAEILPQMLQSVGASGVGFATGAAGGAGAGAAVGSLAGGVGAGPGALAGAAFGGPTGAGVAVFLSAAKQEAGHSFVELRGITDETGQPIDPALAKATALAVGAVNGTLERLSFGVLTKNVPGLGRVLGREGAKRALQSATVRRALSGIAFSATEGAATEGITEGIQEATSIIGEIVASARTRDQSVEQAIEAFQYEGRDPLTGEAITLTGGDAIWARIVSSAVAGAQGGAGAGGAGRAVRAVADSQRAQTALQRLPGIERMRELAGESRLLKRDREAFREHVRTVAEDSGVRSVYIDAAALREWAATADQKAVRQLFQDVEAIQEQDEEVARTGADFQIPLEDFLAYVATNEAASDLLDAVRFDPMDMTAREALGFEEGLVRELGSVSELAGAARDGAQARDLLAGEVRAQLLKVHPDTVVEPMVELTVARYETRAQRLGVPLEELLQREGLFRVEPPSPTEAERQGALPATLEDRLDEAAVRRVVGDLRKGQDLLPAGVSATPVLDAIRALGGVDPEGDLGVGLRELEIPQAGRRGLVRKGGITNADQIVADETPLFVEAGLANAEGLVDHDRLIAAIQEEVLGRPFRTADEGAVLADVQRERDAVLEALDAAGLSLESSDDEIVAAVARREFDQAAQPVENPMVAHHNMTAEKLAMADRIGGLPMPSIAISSAARPMSGFGEITLIGDERMATPSAKNPVHPTDAFSPVYPPIVTQLTRAETKQLNAALSEIVGADWWTVRDEKRNTYIPHGAEEALSEDGDRRFFEHTSIRALFLHEKGHLPIVEGEAREWQRSVDAAIEPLSEEYAAWSRTFFSDRGIAPKRKIFLGFTDSGTRRYQAETAENVLRYMKRELRDQDESTVSGTGEFRARVAQKFRSLRDVKRARGLLTDRGQMDEAAQATTRKAFEIASELSQYLKHPSDNQFMRIDQALDELAMIGRGRSRWGAWLVDVPQDVRDRAIAFVDEMRTMPTEYFEAKPQRVVQLSEFTRAIVPEGDDQSAAILERHGIEVVRYATPEERADRVREAEHVFFEDKRGSITFDDELRNVVIRMTEASDLSTFLHESGHLYLAQLAKDAAEAGGQLEADLAVVREAFGDDVTSTEVQEAWARAFEAYLFEGSAPTLRLRAAFQRFSAWLVRIYKRLRGIPGFQGPLTPEIRGVMDRLIATDEEIEQTRTDLGLDEMDATALGLSEAEAARYRETVERARSEAASEMQAKLMAELARQKTEEWKELREKAHAEVEADVNQRPVFRAKHWLQRGEALEGAPVPILKHARLDRDALRQLYGPDILKVLPKGKYGLWQVNGLHPDTVAEVFGFESGDALVRALSAAGNRLDVIQAETDKLMESRHGKFQTQDEVAQLAIEALSNETQVKALLIEERALAKRAGGRVTPEQVARNAAKRIVGQTKYRDLAPHRYRQAAKRASRDAIEHAAEGRFAEAQASKRRQLVSMFMESEARKAIDQVDRAARYLHDVQKPKSRQRIGKAGGDHLNQMGQLLDRYDLRRGISLREIDRTKGLAAWIKEQEDAGAEVRVPQYLIDRTEKIAWKELTVDELLGLRDAVKNIEHLARMKNEFLANKRRRERDAVRADLVESIRKNATQRELPKELNLSKEEARARSLLSLDTQLVKIEFLADFLDGNDPNGHWKANVVEPIRDVARTRIEKSEQFTEALAGLYQRFLKPNLREYGKRVYLNELGVTGTKLEILMLALNMGAAENVQRIADGNGYSEAQVMALLDRTMTEADWQFVREVWALTGELGKWLFEVEARMTGLEPTKVEGRTIQTRFGEIEGAYFPIVYDPDGSRHSSRQALERANAGMELGIKALLGQPGAAKERVAKVVGRPIKLDLSVIPAHIDELINVLSARETVTQVWQLLDSDEIRNAFKGTTLGLRMYDLFRPWLEDVMRDRVVENRAIGDWSKVLRHVRLGSAVAKLALRETTLAGQLLGHSNAAGILATRLPNWQRHYASGFRRAFSNLRFWQVGNEIQEQSTFMRSRIASRDRDVQDIRRRAITDQLTATGKLKTQIDVMADFGMSLIGWVQFYGVDVPVWLAAYEGGIAEMDMSHDQAVRFADRSVAMSQGSGLRMDQSAVMRGDELMKSLTVFHGYMSTVFNQVDFDVVRSKRSPGARAAAFVSFMVVPTFGYAFVRELLTGRGGPPDDADDWLDYLSWSAGLMMSEMMNLAPIVREASSIPMAMLGGGRYFGGETPIQDQIDKLNDLVHPQDEVEFFADLARFMAPFLGGFPPENVVTKIENAASKD